MTPRSDQEIDREEVARILKITTRTVRNWEKSGIIPPGEVIKRRGDKRWKLKDIERIARELPPVRD